MKQGSVGITLSVFCSKKQHIFFLNCQNMEVFFNENRMEMKNKIDQGVEFLLLCSIKLKSSTPDLSHTQL